MNTKFHSFSGRLTRRIILVMMLTMAIVAGLVVFFSAGSTLVLINHHYEDVLKMTDERIEGMLNVVEVSTANNVDEIRKNLSRPELVQAALENELRLNPHIVGCGVGFTPGYYPKLGRWFELYASREDDGSILVTQIGSPEHDYLQADWYLKSLEGEKGFWSDPYFDEAGAKEMLCTYSLPIRDGNGTVIAVFGADISLAWLTEQIQGVGLSPGEVLYGDLVLSEQERPPFSFILGRNGDYLAHPDPARILNDNYFNHTGEAGDGKYEILGREMLAGRSGHMIAQMDGAKANVYYAPLLRTDWSMAIVVPLSLVVEPGMILGALLLFLLGTGLLVAFFLCRHSIRSTAKPLKQLAVSAEEVAQGRFDAPLPEIRHNDEIRQLRDSFDDMQHSLTNYIDELTAATEQRVSMERELGIAREIQMTMLSKDYPAFPDRNDIDIFGQQNPARAVGGDIYDFFILDDALYFCIGDVSGKGVPAALVMSATSTQFRSLSRGGIRPERLVGLLNESLCSRNATMMFVTLFVGILHLDTGELEYCNAGHDAPVLIGGDGSVRMLDVLPNLALGVMAEQEYVPQRTVLARGSTLFMYTDGLTEAEAPDHSQFGLKRILEVARKTGAVPPRDLLFRMETAVQGFVAGAEQSDDLTMLALRRL